MKFYDELIQKMDVSEKIYYSPSQFAKVTGFSKKEIIRLCEIGAIKAEIKEDYSNHGYKWLIPKDEIKRFAIDIEFL